MKNRSLANALLAVATSALALSACNPNNDDRTAGQKLDSAISKTERQADETKTAVKDASDKAAETVSDAAITASVNAEFTKDSSLSALRINVDTSGGRVLLSGVAPDNTSRERATSLAQGVKGVTAVDNRLEVRS